MGHLRDITGLSVIPYCDIYCDNSLWQHGDMWKGHSISRQAAHKEMKKLIGIDIIEAKGSGKAIYYIIK